MRTGNFQKSTGIILHDSAIESGIDRAIRELGDPGAYARWSGVLRAWHELASDGRLHETSVSVLVRLGRDAD